MNITTRPIPTSDLVAIISKSKQPWKSIYFLAFFTGLRISDLLQLPWQPQPPSQPVIEQKTHKAKQIAWTPLAVGYWKELYNFGNARTFLFPARDPSTYRKRLVRDCKRLGFSTHLIAFHSIRKSAAVVAYNKGGILAAKSAMNHAELSTTERYIETALRLDTSSCYDSIFSSGGNHNG